MNAHKEIMRIVVEATRKLNIDFMLIGGYARDFWTEHFDLPRSLRTTFDVDFACQILIWSDFQRLFDCLKREYHLTGDKKQSHKLWLRDELSLDIVPFGGVADDNGVIAWPPNYDTVLCVLGYDVAKDDAHAGNIYGCEMKVIKPHWLALLKLQSYIGNPSPERYRDLQDVLFLVKHYLDCIDENSRLYGENAIDKDVLDAEDFDHIVAGATLIVRDCLRINRSVTGKILQSIMDFNCENRLVVDFAKANQIKPEMARRIIHEFRLNEAMPGVFRR